MEFATGDALHKPLLLFHIGLVKRAFERPRSRELAASLGRAKACVPRLGSGDADPIVVVHLRAALGPEKSCGSVKGRVVKLRGSKTDLHMIRISEHHIEIVPAVPRVRAQLASAPAHGIFRMPLKSPVAH